MLQNLSSAAVVIGALRVKILIYKVQDLGNIDLSSTLHIYLTDCCSDLSARWLSQTPGKKCVG